MPKSLDSETVKAEVFCGEKMLLTVFPSSLSRGSTWTVIPRDDASHAGPNRNRIRPCSKMLSLNLCSISATNPWEIQRQKG